MGKRKVSHFFWYLQGFKSYVTPVFNRTEIARNLFLQMDEEQMF